MKETKVIFFCSTKDFSKFTRRSTTEALGKLLPNSLCICVSSFWRSGKVKIQSDHIKTIPYYYFIPYKLLRISNFLVILNHLLNKLMNSKITFENYSTVIMSTPRDKIFLSYFKNSKKIFILSDPYHLMGYTYNDTKKILYDANIVLCTSKELSKSYSIKYFDLSNKKFYYWPNCVDISVWDINKFKNFKHSKDNDYNENALIIGFAGNLMEVTDIDLLRNLVYELKNFHFIIAGECKYRVGSSEMNVFSEIVNLSNVTYRGYIHYNELPKEIIKWDICIMIDKLSELALYHHHNKIYQYLAMGKPVVYQENIEDYLFLKHVTFPAKNLGEFVRQVHHLQEKLKTNSNMDYLCIKTANENSSSNRASQIIHLI